MHCYALMLELLFGHVSVPAWGAESLSAVLCSLLPLKFASKRTGLKVNSQPILFKIDTGAQCNVMSSETYRSISSEIKCQACCIRLKSALSTPCRHTHMPKQH